jgi:hypothetical protein
MSSADASDIDEHRADLGGRGVDVSETEKAIVRERAGEEPRT